MKAALKMNKSELKTLYSAQEINEVWSENQKVPVINHPQYGYISPNKYRAINKGKPCPYCGKIMVHGQDFHSTSSNKEARERGYEYIDSQGNKVINEAGGVYFHPHYLTLDHITNKARCPERMFDYDNLQLMCWRCNRGKGDDNTYELKHGSAYLNSLTDEALARYPLL